jgi:heptosyltransferase-2
MKHAKMNYANDSAPTHLASAVNAPISTVFCSTLPAFGFTPLSSDSHIIEYDGELDCRPCGIHGHRTCPEKHFKCGNEIKTEQLLKVLKV